MSRTQINQSLVPSANASIQNIINIADNGGFEIWQRTTSFTNPAINTYTADRWKVSVTGAPSWVVSRDSTPANVDNGTYSMSVNITSVGGSTVFNLYQLIEDFAAYRGKTLTVSMRVKASVAGKIQIRLESDLSSTFSSFHSGSGTFETLTATLLIPTNASQLDIQVGMLGLSSPVATQFWVDSAMLVMGNQAIPFVPTNPQVDLARCQRYFQILTNLINNYLPEFCGQVETATHVTGHTRRFIVPMRTNPTVVISSPSHFSVSNSSGGSVAVANIGVSGINTGDGSAFVWSANVAAGLTAGAMSLVIVTTTGGFISFSADL